MIEFRHVDKVYPNGVKGLQDINLTIDQGEFVAIIGLSGAGKSTLIRTINRMIDVTGGQLIVDGTDVMSLKGKAMRRYRRKIGMIFQSYNLVTRTTAIKNVLTSMVPDMSFFRVLLQIHYRVHQRAHLKPVRSLNAALRDIAVLNVESPGRSGGQHVARVPALDGRVKGYEAGRNVGHMIHGVLGVHLSVQDGLDVQFQHIRHLIRRYQLRTEREECGEILHDGKITGVAGNIIVAL